MISSAEYRTIVEYAETQALDGLWAYITPDMLPSLHIICEDSSFSERKKIFFWFFDKNCPGGAVWILKDGTQEWT